MPVYEAKVTNTGLAKLAAADADGPAVNITTVKAGDGNGVYVSPDETWLDITNVVWTGAINRVFQSANDATIFVAEAKIPVEVGPFWVREMGFYDAAGDLIIVMNVPDSYKPSLAEGAARDQYYRTYFKHSNASSVTVSVDPSVVMATQLYVDTALAAFIDQPLNTTSSPTFVNLTITSFLNGGFPWTSSNDGHNSGLDADTLDGLHATSLARLSQASNFTVAPTINSATIWTSANDGAGSGLDADLFDGLQSTQYARLASANNFIIAPTINSATIWTSANDGAGSGLDADLWDGNQFATYLNQAVKTTSNVIFNQVTSTAGLFFNSLRNNRLVPLDAPEQITSYPPANSWQTVTHGTLVANNATAAILKAGIEVTSGIASTTDFATNSFHVRKTGSVLPADISTQMCKAYAQCNVVGQYDYDHKDGLAVVPLNASHQFDYHYTLTTSGGNHGQRRLYLIGYIQNC